MTVLSSVLSAVFWGMLVLSALVFVHEGGHFLVARAFGMRVTEFFLGLPSRYRLSFKSKKIGTEFGVTPFLLGGYNRICGMDGEYDDLLAPALAIVQDSGRISVQDLASRLSIEREHAYELLAVLVDMGSIRPYYNEAAGEYAWQPDWPEAFETLERDGNLLTEYDAKHDFSSPGTTPAGVPRPVRDERAFFEQECARTYRGKGFVPRVLTLLAGPMVNIVFSLTMLIGALMIGGVEVNANSNVLGGVSEGSLAQAAGLREGDTILQLGGRDVATWVDLCDAIDLSLEQGDDIPVAYERNGETFETVIDLPEGEKVELIGVSALMETYHPSFSEAVQVSFSYVKLVGSTVARIIMPQHTIEVVSQSSSIVGISAMASEAAASGMEDLILLAAAISMSLGFMNLLPVPPLDGGKILIELIQLVARRELSPKARSAVSYLGLAFFLFIFCFALRNDIMMLLGFG